MELSLQTTAPSPSRCCLPPLSPPLWPSVSPPPPQTRTHTRRSTQTYTQTQKRQIRQSPTFRTVRGWGWGGVVCLCKQILNNQEKNGIGKRQLHPQANCCFQCLVALPGPRRLRSALKMLCSQPPSLQDKQDNLSFDGARTVRAGLHGAIWDS